MSTIDPQIVKALKLYGEARWIYWTRKAAAPETIQPTEYAARPAQLPHPTKRVSFFMAGRGTGKTCAGAEHLAHLALTEPGAYGIVGPDYGHLITECLEGYLFDIIPERYRQWRGQINQLDLANGSLIKLYTAKVPDKVRGPNLKGCWFDEPGEMRFGENAWYNASLATRIKHSSGADPQLFVTGTPKRVKLVQHLLKKIGDNPESYHFSQGQTRDNEANLSTAYIEELYAELEGTTLGLQELQGIMIQDVAGALMRQVDIEEHRQETPHLSPGLTALSIDPGFSDKQTADECGIVIGHRIGAGNNSIAEVLDDASRRGTPGSWGSLVAAKCDEYDVDVVVFEGNLTGQWVKETLTEALSKCKRRPRLESVISRSSKWARAEPVAALAERGRYRMVGEFGGLESELTSWVPDTKMKSPNRLDAWAQLGRYLLIKSSGTGSVGKRPTRRVQGIV